MLELLIALVLIATCALPLAQLPIKAAQEEFNCTYRMHAERLADLAFAKVKEKLYRQEISWEEICSPKGSGAQVFEDTVEIDIASRNKKKFIRRSILSSTGKKLQNGEELRLATVKIQIISSDKKFKPFRTKKGVKTTRNFTYQVLLTKPPLPIASAPAMEGAA